MEGDDAPLRGWLLEGDIGDGAGAAKDAHTALPAACEGGHTLDDVTATSNLHDVGSEGVGAFLVYDDGGLGLVLRPRRPAPGPACGVAICTGQVYLQGIFAIAVAATASVVIDIAVIIVITLLASIEAPMVVLGFGLLQPLVEVVMEVPGVEWRCEVITMR